MFKGFRRKKELEQQIFQLNHQIQQLEERIRDLKETPQYQIHVDKIEIDKVALEQLTFRLDKLDIDELSGALNLGNNFGVSVGGKKGSLKKEETSSTSTNINATPKGYSFSFQQKKEE